MGSLDRGRGLAQDRGLTRDRGLIKDLRHGLRAFTRRPGFAAMVVLTLALGLGGVSAVLDFLNLIYWRSLPVHRPQELVRVFHRHPIDWIGPYGALSYPDYEDYRQRSQAFQDLAAYLSLRLRSGSAPDSPLLDVSLASGNFFHTLGLQPALGRLLEPADDQPGSAGNALLSHAYWSRTLGADPEVLGRVLQLQGQPYTIVGVLPRSFTGTLAGNRTDLWLTLSQVPKVMDPEAPGLEVRRRAMINTIGRLRPGTGHAQAEAELATHAELLDRLHPLPDQTRQVTVTPLRHTHPVDQKNLASTARLVAIAAALVFLITCTNVANLLLAQARSRRGEMVLRQAVGASRGRLARQLFTESLLLALAGGLIGLLLSLAARALLRFHLADFVRDMRFDHRVLGGTLLACLVATLIAGLAPALAAARTNLVSSLEGRGGLSHASPLGRRTLVALQIALSMALLATTVQVSEGLWRLWRADLGFESQGLLSLRPTEGAERLSRQAARRVYLELKQKAAAMPGVEKAALGFLLPPVMMDITLPFRLAEEPEVLHSSQFNWVDGDFFPTLGLALQEGRLFHPADGDSPHGVVVLNRLLAEQLWPGKSPLGQRLLLERRQDWEPATYEVIGVVADSVQNRSGAGFEPILYFSAVQRFRPNFRLILRLDGDPQPVIDALRRELEALSPGAGFDSILSGEDTRRNALSRERLQAQTQAALGSLGLLLAMIGVFGVTTYTLSQERKSIGIRMALGANRRAIRRWILGRGLGLALLGLALGLPATLWATRLLRRSLPQMASPSLPMLLAVSLILTLAVLLATYLPAHRAARIDPLEVLRQD